MNIHLTLLLILVSLIQTQAQSVRTDTVKQGYYIPFGTNYMSCKVSIIPAGKKVEFTNTTGNKLSDSLIQRIAGLQAGSVVTYSEVTVLQGATMVKAPTVRYVIGSKNTVNALRDPSLPDTLPAKELSTLVLDKHVYSFDVSWMKGGAYTIYSLTGNGISGQVTEEILALPSGTKVWIENIRRQEDDGSRTMSPTKIYIVK